MLTELQKQTLILLLKRINPYYHHVNAWITLFNYSGYGLCLICYEDVYISNEHLHGIKHLKEHGLLIFS